MRTHENVAALEHKLAHVTGRHVAPKDEHALLLPYRHIPRTHARTHVSTQARTHAGVLVHTHANTLT